MWKCNVWRGTKILLFWLFRVSQFFFRNDFFSRLWKMPQLYCEIWELYHAVIDFMLIIFWTLVLFWDVHACYNMDKWCVWNVIVRIVRGEIKNWKYKFNLAKIVFLSASDDRNPKPLCERMECCDIFCKEDKKATWGLNCERLFNITLCAWTVTGINIQKGFLLLTRLGKAHKSNCPDMSSDVMLQCTCHILLHCVCNEAWHHWTFMGSWICELSLMRSTADDQIPRIFCSC